MKEHFKVLHESLFLNKSVVNVCFAVMTKFKLNHWVTMRISFAIVTLLPICTTGK